MAAGTVADLDAVSVFFGPSAYLQFRRTFFHSLPAAILIAIVCAALVLLLARGKDSSGSGTAADSASRTGANSTRNASRISESLALVLAATLAASTLHLALDLCQSQGIELFWPFSTRRFFLDWLAPLDLWILAILLAGIFLPRLAALVSDEIGAKSKSPRGRVGASLALAAILLFVSVRAILHDNAIVALDSRIYRGEVPHRVAALPDPRSPFRWTGIVETQSALHEATLNLAAPASFDSDSAFTSFKPQPSPALDAAQNTPVARLFLSATRFPKASIEQTPSGFHVALRPFPFTSSTPPLNSESFSSLSANFGRPIVALIDTTPSAQILDSRLTWLAAVALDVTDAPR